MRIAIVAHGRFHAFDLARALLAQDHDVMLFTNYPRWAVERFGVPAARCRSFAAHGVLTRLASRVTARSSAPVGEGALHAMFGRWAARVVDGHAFDLIHCWSGISEELITRQDRGRARTLLMRGSAHIETQTRILDEEAVRSGHAVDGPSTWMRQREQREYAHADHIVVLSTFARRSFIDHGVAAERVSVVPLGVDVAAFRASADVVRKRRARILSGTPLRVLYAGAISQQKGIADLMAATRAVDAADARFTLVGPLTADAQYLVQGHGDHVTIEVKRPQHELPPLYWEADLFVFPTLQDGFGMVLTQAKAAGLPIVATSHSAAPDLIAEGRDGWIIPIRSAEALAERVRWCASHRPEFAGIADAVSQSYQPADWSDVARNFLALADRLASAVPTVLTHG